MARFGGSKFVSENPESFASIPGTHSQHIEVHNVGVFTVWVGDETLAKAREGPNAETSFSTLPPTPLRGRQLMPGEYFHIVVNPNDELRVCRLRDQIHVGAITVDWRAEIAWYVVEDDIKVLRRG